MFIAKKREVVTLLFLLCLPCDKAMCSWDGLFLYFFKCRGAFKELSAVVRFTALNFCLLVCFGSHILELSWGVAHGIYVQANVRIYVDWWRSQAKYQITHELGCTLFCGDMTWPLNSLQGILPLKPKYEKRSFRMKWSSTWTQELSASSTKLSVTQVCMPSLSWVKWYARITTVICLAIN